MLESALAISYSNANKDNRECYYTRLVSVISVQKDLHRKAETRTNPVQSQLNCVAQNSILGIYHPLGNGVNGSKYHSIHLANASLLERDSLV